MEQAFGSIRHDNLEMAVCGRGRAGLGTGDGMAGRVLTESTAHHGITEITEAARKGPPLFPFRAVSVFSVFPW